MAVPSLAARPVPVLLSLVAAPSPSSWGSSSSSGRVMSPPSQGMPSSGANANATETPPVDEPNEEAPALEQGRQSTSSSSSSSSSSSAGSLFHLDAADLGNSSVPALLPEDDEQAATPVQSAPVKPDEWATWSEETPQTVPDEFFSADSGGTAFPEPTTEAPLVQTMPKLNAAAAPAKGSGGFDPDRIPASVFQPRTSSASQADWSVVSNESLFSIQGASQSSADLGGLYAGGSRSHFDYFYDEAMAAAEQDSKLPPVSEGTEPGDGNEFAVPGSAGSEASHGSAGARKAAAVFRRHESGSGGSSSNFSFAFPILAETSPKKKDCVTAALYQPLQKEYEPPMPQPLAPPSTSSAFVEMTTEEERKRSDGWCCCGCCWFDCSAWSSCCCWCCRWRWWQCGCCQCSCPSLYRWRWWQCGCCQCSCPNLCRCNWCFCF